MILLMGIISFSMFLTVRQVPTSAVGSVPDASRRRREGSSAAGGTAVGVVPDDVPNFALNFIVVTLFLFVVLLGHRPALSWL